MMPAPQPSNGRQRLATLRSLKILDTPPEERFDRVTRLARRVFNVPIALVSLVDEERHARDIRKKRRLRGRAGVG